MVVAGAEFPLVTTTSHGARTRPRTALTAPTTNGLRHTTISAPAAC